MRILSRCALPDHIQTLEPCSLEVLGAALERMDISCIKREPINYMIFFQNRANSINLVPHLPLVPLEHWSLPERQSVTSDTINIKYK